MFGFVISKYYDENKSSDNKYLLTIDGFPVGRNIGSVNLFGRELIASLYSTAFHERLILLSPKELIGGFSSFDFPSTKDWDKEWNHGFEGFDIDRFKLSYYSDNISTLTIDFYFSFTDWKSPWSIREHARELKSVVSSKSELGADWTGFSQEHEDFVNEISLSFLLQNLGNSIYSDLEKIFSILNDIQQETLLILRQKLQPKSILRYFNFPDEVKVACEQYLLYFIQFLHDIGIEAKGEITEKANGVLFSITPKNQGEALETISKVLDVYLCLPSKSDLNLSIPLGSDVEVQRLSANIYHLQGQLALASAIIQQKDLIIDQQNQLIQQQEFSAQILIQSAQRNQTKQEEKEPLIDGVLSVKKSEFFKGLELDLPNIVRAVKNMVRKQN